MAVIRSLRERRLAVGPIALPIRRCTPRLIAAFALALAFAGALASTFPAAAATATRSNKLADRVQQFAVLPSHRTKHCPKDTALQQ